MAMNKSESVHKVVIVGAGVSGLSAARHLVKNGISDILILEATEKPGGRIQTSGFGRETGPETAIIELGAQWIHGEQNELCQLIKSANHRHSKTSWEGKGKFLLPTGGEIDNDTVNEVLGWIEDSIEEVEASYSIETIQKFGNGNRDDGHSSMGKQLLENFQSYLRRTYPDHEENMPEYNMRMALFQWGMSFQRVDNSCDKMNDVSLYRWSEFEVNPGEHYNNFLNGAQKFIDEILVGESLRDRILYNTPVINIDWTEGSGEGGRVKIKTKSGHLFQSEIVLVTCSIGVLTSNMDSLFSPPLPEKQAKAIACTGFGPVTKIFLEWSQPWWPNDLQGFQLVWPTEYINCCDGSHPNDLDETWYKSITGFDPVLENPNVLLAWLGGPEAVHAEKLSNDEIMKKCQEILQKFTGINVPEPVKVAVSKWNTNEYFRGAYSFRSVDGDEIHGDICSILADPVTISDNNGVPKPVLVLAGEALSKSHYSTLHGAYESGIAQASKIIQHFSTVNSSSMPISTTSQLSAKANENSCSKRYVDNESDSLGSTSKDAKIYNAFHVANNIRVPS